MDAAKSIALIAVNDGDYWDYIPSGTGKGKPVSNRPLPIVAITTTAGHRIGGGRGHCHHERENA